MCKFKNHGTFIGVDFNGQDIIWRNEVFISGRVQIERIESKIVVRFEHQVFVNTTRAYQKSEGRSQPHG